jgi:hypothetical protein
MNPLSLIFGGLGGLGSLFGGGGGGSKITPEMLARLFGPQALAGDTNQLYSLMANSPGSRAALGSINMAGQNLAQDLSAGFARRGLTSTGIGTVGQGLANAASGFGQANYQGQLQGQAMDAAQQNLMARLQAFMSNKNANVGQPGGFERIFGSILGAAGPALGSYFGNKNKQQQDQKSAWESLFPSQGQGRALWQGPGIWG